MKNFVANLTVIHQRIFDRPWLHSSTDWRYAIGAGLLILLAAMINFDMRDGNGRSGRKMTLSSFMKIHRLFRPLMPPISRRWQKI